MRVRPRSGMAREEGLGSGEESGGFAEKLCGLAGFGEDAYGTGEPAGLLANAFEVGVEAGEDDDAAGGLLAGDFVDQRETVAARHGDVAEEEVGGELAGAAQTLIRGVGGTGVEATFLKDKSKGVCDQTIIIYYQNSLHGLSLEIKLLSTTPIWLLQIRPKKDFLSNE